MRSCSCPGSVAWHRHSSSEFQASNVGLIMADRVCQSTEVRFSGSVAMLRRDIVPTTTVQSSKGNPLTTTDWQRA